MNYLMVHDRILCNSQAAIQKQKLRIYQTDPKLHPVVYHSLTTIGSLWCFSIELLYWQSLPGLRLRPFKVVEKDPKVLKPGEIEVLIVEDPLTEIYKGYVGKQL